MLNIMASAWDKSMMDMSKSALLFRYIEPPLPEEEEGLT